MARTAFGKCPALRLHTYWHQKRSASAANARACNCACGAQVDSVNVASIFRGKTPWRLKAAQVICSMWWSCWVRPWWRCLCSRSWGWARCWGTWLLLAIGPFGFGVFTDAQSILHVAELGVVMFLFVIAGDAALALRRCDARFSAGQPGSAWSVACRRWWVLRSFLSARVVCQCHGLCADLRPPPRSCWVNVATSLHRVASVWCPSCCLKTC